MTGAAAAAAGDEAAGWGAEPGAGGGGGDGGWGRGEGGPRRPPGAGGRAHTDAHTYRITRRSRAARARACAQWHTGQRRAGRRRSRGPRGVERMLIRAGVLAAL